MATTLSQEERRVQVTMSIRATTIDLLDRAKDTAGVNRSRFVEDMILRTLADGADAKPINQRTRG